MWLEDRQEALRVITRVTQVEIGFQFQMSPASVICLSRVISWMFFQNSQWKEAK